ncbi:hypothetical protein JY96_13435 [Aquabacterium sp. NJ1]|nr:hypothetical protein JY96_13435 [Aquabacterium sp. NJ1]
MLRIWTAHGLRAGLVGLLALLTAFCVNAHAGDDFLAVEDAFKVEASVAPSGHDVRIEVAIAPRTHLYRDRLSFQPISDAMKLGTPFLPPGKRQYDETFGKVEEVYYDHLSISLPVLDGLKSKGYVMVGYQGCADDGLCYPPQVLYLRVRPGVDGRLASVELAQAEEVAGGAAAQPEGAASLAALATSASAPVVKDALPPKAADGGSSIERALASGNLFKIVGVFFLAGLLLSFTPCVLPMVPILSSIIVGEGSDVGRVRGFVLALSYSQGMALVYTAMGVAAGLLGEGLASYLQNPIVLSVFALMLVAFALSMFGAYELQMPSFIQGHLTARSTQLKGGSLIGVFLMGLLSALIVGPCVTGPLAGALLYISQTRDVVFGGTALYALACGMSVPLLLVGVSAGSLLPNTGMWMESVKTFFGMVMLGVALWLVSPVLPSMALLGLLGVWLALGGALFGAFDAIGPQSSVRHRAVKGLGSVFVVLGLFELVGALTGATNPWAPLSEVRGGAVSSAVAATTSATTDKKAGLPFRTVANAAALEAALAEASAQGKLAMVDFYADWCVACKEMEHLTFSDKRVQDRLAKVVLIQANVTETNAETKGLLKRFSLFGPPGVVFFDANGRELSDKRVVGFQRVEEFLRSLASAGA